MVYRRHTKQCRRKQTRFQRELISRLSHLLKPHCLHCLTHGAFLHLQDQPCSIFKSTSASWSQGFLWLHLSPREITQEDSVQFSHSVVSDSLRPHELQHARPPCPSPTPGVHSNPRPSSRWCHPAISSSVIPFSSCPQSLPASESFPMSQLFAWGGQSIHVSIYILYTCIYTHIKKQRHYFSKRDPSSQSYVFF